MTSRCPLGSQWLPNASCRSSAGIYFEFRNSDFLICFLIHPIHCQRETTISHPPILLMNPFFFFVAEIVDRRENGFEEENSPFCQLLSAA
ncbi:MAG: hypothetical protein D6679_08785 [Candidatus Hydrogenedentota bacterium]|nr:MAG: hypothetical protein D6679_08785 [Candidatus Hydrogenedentota bacterium]